ncbi:MAG: hypothetical protein H7A33_05440 [Deltaproteobacteria bacterium]|nr:hypothetical protein [Deltaproteobacteria bacterium]
MLVGQHIQIPRAYQPNYAFAVSCGFPYHLDGVYKDQVLAREPFKNEPSLDTPARDVFELLKNGFLHGARAGTDLRNHINTIGTYPRETAEKRSLVRAFNDAVQAFYDATLPKSKSRLLRQTKFKL